MNTEIVMCNGKKLLDVLHHEKNLQKFYILHLLKVHGNKWLKCTNTMIKSIYKELGKKLDEKIKIYNALEIF